MAVVVALFRASHDDLPKISKSFRSESTRVKSSIDRLNQVIQTLEGGDWVGEGANAFFREMRSEVMPALQRLLRALEMGADVSQKIDRVIEELEQASTGFFAAIVASFEGALVGEVGGMGGQAEAAAGGSGGGASAATSEKPSSGGGGGGAGGGSGGGGSGGGGGSWDGEIGFKQGKPPTKPGKR